MAVKKLRDYLDQNHIKYMILLHSPAFTAQEIAASAHVSGRKLAKTVIVKLKKGLAMIVLPAKDHVNFAELRSITGDETVDLAVESEFKDRFPGCEVGAMPPFGSLYGMPVFITGNLASERILIFNAGSHSELMQVAMKDFEQLEHPKLLAHIA